MTVINANSGTTAEISNGLNSNSAKTAAQTFLEYMDMTPGERMRATILGELGYTEEQLKALPPKEREKIEQEIRERIKEKIENSAGKF